MTASLVAALFAVMVVMAVTTVMTMTAATVVTVVRAAASPVEETAVADSVLAVEVAVAPCW